MMIAATTIQIHLMAVFVLLWNKKLIVFKYYRLINDKMIPHMASFGKKKTITDYWYSRPVIFVLCIALIFLVISIKERYLVEREMSARTTATEKEKLELLERKQMLEEKVEYLSGDRGIEEEIRTHFDVAKQGEKVIILVGDEKKAEVTPTIPQEPKPWYKFW